MFVHIGILYAGTVDALSDIVEAHCDKWRIDLDEHTHNRINQSIATDCRTFQRHRHRQLCTLCAQLTKAYMAGSLALANRHAHRLEL